MNFSNHPTTNLFGFPVYYWTKNNFHFKAFYLTILMDIYFFFFKYKKVITRNWMWCYEFYNQFFFFLKISYLQNFHFLKLKKGSIVTLLQVLNSRIGLFKRAPFGDVINELFIHAGICTRRNANNEMLIPRSNLSDMTFAFQMKRQFPILPSLSRTTNKNLKRQSFVKRVFLPQFVFNQLYVALSWRGDQTRRD